MPAYVVVDITVHDRDDYERYKGPAAAAVAAYAEAVSDGVADELRGSMFRAIWAHGLNLSSRRRYAAW